MAKNKQVNNIYKSQLWLAVKILAAIVLLLGSIGKLMDQVTFWQVVKTTIWILFALSVTLDVKEFMSNDKK